MTGEIFYVGILCFLKHVYLFASKMAILVSAGHISTLSLLIFSLFIPFLQTIIFFIFSLPYFISSSFLFPQLSIIPNFFFLISFSFLLTERDKECVGDGAYLRNYFFRHGITTVTDRSADRRGVQATHHSALGRPHSRAAAQQRQEDHHQPRGCQRCRLRK